MISCLPIASLAAPNGLTETAAPAAAGVVTEYHSRECLSLVDGKAAAQDGVSQQIFRNKREDKDSGAAAA